MRLCVKSGSVCETLTWAGDHNDALANGDQKPREIYTIKRWDSYIRLAANLPGEDVSQSQASLSGLIAQSGDHVTHGTVEFVVAPRLRSLTSS
jgi:hypothetical protein